MSLPIAQLSCEQCQQRKKKCSKTVPCTSCVRSNIACTSVRRNRLPRGRTGNKKPDKSGLQDRVARLEALISSLGRDPQIVRQSESLSSSESPHQPVQYAGSDEQAFLASDFWQDLTQTVSGLKDILDQDVNDGTPAEEMSTTMATPTSSLQGPRLSAYPLSGSLGSSVHHRGCTPSQDLKTFLLTIYHERVDAVFKVLHWPSTRNTIIAGNEESRCLGTVGLPDSLEAAVLFTAVCSLHDHEIADRGVILERSRSDVEMALTRENFLTSTRLPVLQAFVIYLAGLRACQANAEQWTLLPTAIRMASARGIPKRLHTVPRTFEGELQKRLWFCIGVLDLQSAFDRGTQPLLTSNDFPALPLDLNDDELNSDPTYLLQDSARSRFTDMTFALLVNRAGICQRRIVELDFPQTWKFAGIDASQAGHEQLRLLQEFESYARSIPVSQDAPTTFQRFTLAVAEESLMAMKLLLHRPLHKRDSTHRPPLEPIDVLATATEVLRRSQNKRTLLDFSPWAWFSWIKWFALAIVLVELCTARGESADEAWAVAQASYQDYAEVVADTKRGLLWKPIERLMQKVRRTRARLIAHALDEQTVGANDTADPGAFRYSQGDQAKYGDPGLVFNDDYFNTVLHDDVAGMSWVHWDLLTQDINDSFMDDFLGS